ncbi:MAG: hypothetical protein ACLQVI_34155, partial [Polyangiaceae bacterium]
MTDPRERKETRMNAYEIRCWRHPDDVEHGEIVLDVKAESGADAWEAFRHYWAEEVCDQPGEECKLPAWPLSGEEAWECC